MTDAVWEELVESFRRYRPQGSHQWNFAAAFGQLHALVTASATEGPASPTGQGLPDHAAGRPSTARRQLQSLLSRAAGRALALPPEPAGRQEVADLRYRLDEGLEATLEAFRFLAARVDHLEGQLARAGRPVEGLAWLVEPPDVDACGQPLAAWLRSRRGAGQVAVAECGDGCLVAELEASLAVSVVGVEPRGALAAQAGERGVTVEVAAVADWLDRVDDGSLGALVLADVVDRLPVDGLVELLELAGRSLAPAAPLVVLGRHPEAGRWSVAARELLPGHPLHAETWQVLLERHGFEEVEAVPAVQSGPTYAVGGRRGP